jgi:hypothetical protein
MDVTTRTFCIPGANGGIPISEHAMYLIFYWELQ